MKLLCRCPRKRQCVGTAYLDIIPNSRLLTFFYLQEKLFFVLKTDVFIQDRFDTVKAPYVAADALTTA